MINVNANNGRVVIKHAEGTAVILMSELCCIVNAVCTAFCEDEENSEEMRKGMIITIADALKSKEDRGAKLEDDENADF